MTTLRITGGSLRGRKVPLPGHELRATSSKARQAFFNILSDRITDAVFLDLFAGSGIFSLEAVSRGAARAIAVDQSKPAMKALHHLAREWNLPIETVPADALAALRSFHRNTSIDVVYADPPYTYTHYRELLRAIDRLPFAPRAVVALEHQSRSEPRAEDLAQLALRKTARYGNVSISIYDTPGA